MNKVKTFVACSALVAGISGACYGDEMKGVNQPDTHKTVSSESIEEFQTLIAKDIVLQLCREKPYVPSGISDPFNKDTRYVIEDLYHEDKTSEQISAFAIQHAESIKEKIHDLLSDSIPRFCNINFDALFQKKKQKNTD